MSAVVLLRAVNVGGRNRVPMAELRSALEASGLAGVRTHLASGNVVVPTDGPDAGSVGEHVRSVVRERFDVDVACLVRDLADLDAVVAADPLADVVTDQSRHLVVFLDGEPSPGLFEAVDLGAFLPERAVLVGREVHCWHPDGSAAAKLLHSFWERRLGVAATARNWRTVLALREMLRAPAPGGNP